MDPRALRDAYGHASNLPGHTNNAFQDVTRILARVARAGVSVEEIYDDDDDAGVALRVGGVRVKLSELDRKNVAADVECLM